MQTIFTLDREGATTAAVMGVAVLFFGGALGMGLFFLFELLFFLVLSKFATEAKKRKKMGLGLYERSRGWKNVVANGGIPLILAFAYFLNSAYGFGMAGVIVIAYVASVAAVTADKFASEIGVLDGTPITLLTLKKAKKGASGAVTLLGLGASLAATLAISAGIFLLHGSAAYFAVIVIAGFTGSLMDSVFGYFEERGTGNKYTTNIACAITGAAVGAALLMLL